MDLCITENENNKSSQIFIIKYKHKYYSMMLPPIFTLLQ